MCLGVKRHLASGREISRLQHGLQLIMARYTRIIHCRPCCNLYLFLSRSPVLRSRTATIEFLGEPLQVTVRRMLRDRCPVCPVCMSVTLVHCGRTVGWIKMPLGTEVGLGQGDAVLDGDPAPPRKGAQQPPPHFSAHVYCSQSVAHLSYCWAVVNHNSNFRDTSTVVNATAVDVCCTYVIFITPMIAVVWVGSKVLTILFSFMQGSQRNMKSKTHSLSID